MEITKDIRDILRIAKIELNSMFYSPVAWLILVVFTFQIGYGYSTPLAMNLHSQDLYGGGLWKISNNIFLSFMYGFLPRLLRTLYLYIPLVTMGLMSREYQSGSIKLLYSSPIKNSSIILGKFLTMVCYGFVLMAVLGIFVIFSDIVIKDFELSMILTSVLGLYLLLLAYSAIGLFMSSLTKYQVVAAIGTLALLAVLNFIGNVGRDIDWVRDITYWLSITGRTSSFLDGMIASEDLFYFLLVIIFFLALSILKLNMEKNIMPLKVKILKFSVIVVIIFICGSITMQPNFKFYYDATHVKSNTLSEESQEVLNELNNDITITTYVNLLDQDYHRGLPRNRNDDEKSFEKYYRFKPDIKMKYVYYYDKVYNQYTMERYKGLTDKEKAIKICTSEGLDLDMFMTPEEIKAYTKERGIDLSKSENKFVRVLETGKGERAYLRVFNDMSRMPSEAEISAALKTFIYPSPTVAFTLGNGSRRIDNYGDRGYYLFAHDKFFRQSLLNNGFKTKTIDLVTQDIDDSVNVLVISDLKDSLTELELRKVINYIDKGGNMFIMGEYNRSTNMNKLVKKLGVSFSDGVLVQKNEYSSPSIIFAKYTEIAAKTFPIYWKKYKYGWSVSAPTSVAIDYSDVKNYSVIPILKTEKDVWLEYETTDFVDGEYVYNSKAGEKKGEFSTLIGLHREIGGKNQRIIISGDSDFISNKELTTKRNDASQSNYDVITASFRWLSDDTFPVDVRRDETTDDKIYLPKGFGPWMKFISYGIFPLLLILLGIILIYRRKRK